MPTRLSKKSVELPVCQSFSELLYYCDCHGNARQSFEGPHEIETRRVRELSSSRPPPNCKGDGPDPAASPARHFRPHPAGCKFKATSLLKRSITYETLLKATRCEYRTDCTDRRRGQSLNWGLRCIRPEMVSRQNRFSCSGHEWLRQWGLAARLNSLISFKIQLREFCSILKCLLRQRRSEDLVYQFLLFSNCPLPL